MANELETYAVKLCDSAKAEGISLRLFGSCAIRIKCGKFSEIFDRCNRHPKDIDCVVRRKDRSRLQSMLLAQGWQESVELTAQTDGSRLQFRAPERIVLDVSVDVLRFAQTLDVTKRFELDSPTLPAADLLLSKLQIQDLTSFDLIDMIVLLYAIPPSDDNIDVIDLSRIAEITSRSWGWYKSVTKSLLAIDQALGKPICDLSESDRKLIRSRASLVERRILGAPKSLWWKARSLIGEALPWHNKVEVSSDLSVGVKER